MSIPIPQGMEQAPVTWTLAHTTGRESLAGARGFVRFEPTAVAVALPSMTVLPRPVEARVVGGVMEPVELMVNDPELWNWRVVPEVGVAWAAFHVDVLGPVDLATVVVVPGKGPIRAVTGPPGKGLNLLGEKPSSADLPGGATEGDAWLVGTDLHVWGGGRWVNAGPIRGPQGVEGERGPQGEKGEKGDTPTWEDLPGKPTSFPSTIPDVDGLERWTVGTGWRDLTPYLAPGVTPSSNIPAARFQRVGNTVEFAMKVDLADDYTSNVICTFPAGFRAPSYRYLPGAYTSPSKGAGASSMVPIDMIGYISSAVLQTPSSKRLPGGSTLIWAGRFDTNDPWPTTPPGDPA